MCTLLQHHILITQVLRVGDKNQRALPRTGITYALELNEVLKIGLGTNRTPGEYKNLKRFTGGLKPVAEDIVARGEPLQPLIAVLVTCEDFLPRAEEKKWHLWPGRVCELSELIATALACYCIDDIPGCGGMYGNAISGGDASRRRGGTL
jgi:hypothetical protein